MNDSYPNNVKEILNNIDKVKNIKDLETIYVTFSGKSGLLKKLSEEIQKAPPDKKSVLGKSLNSLKKVVLKALNDKKTLLSENTRLPSIDVTRPVNFPHVGSLHIVTQAIEEITEIFSRLGYSSLSYPEVEWDYYSFTSLNFPDNHPARDDFETFFIDEKTDKKYGRMLLSPHTSSGQIREMNRVKTPPVRMINIAKCYRRNWDISHNPMFHQFEGVYIDKGINISHLKGTLAYFAENFFGKDRKTRLRPFHFQFTEPSFEIDISCALCNGTGKLSKKIKCRTCKEGWLELGGCGMIHPEVLKEGKIDNRIYSGFAFGWGIERTYMMKINLEDMRILYNNDIRFLEQL